MLYSHFLSLQLLFKCIQILCVIISITWLIEMLTSSPINYLIDWNAYFISHQHNYAYLHKLSSFNFHWITASVALSITGSIMHTQPTHQLTAGVNHSPWDVMAYVTQHCLNWQCMNSLYSMVVELVAHVLFQWTNVTYFVSAVHRIVHEPEVFDSQVAR